MSERERDLRGLFGNNLPPVGILIAAEDHPLAMERFRAQLPYVTGILRGKVFPSCEGSGCDQGVMVSFLQFSILKRLITRRLRWEDLVGLAAGASLTAIHSLHGKTITGRCRLCWRIESDFHGPARLVPEFEFLPDQDLGSLDFEQWLSVRYPSVTREEEATVIWIHDRWMSENPHSVGHPSIARQLKTATIRAHADVVDYLLGLGVPSEELTGLNDGSLMAIAHKDADSDAARRIITVFESLGAKDFRALPIAAAGGDVETVRRLIGEGFPVNFSSETHPPALLAAIDSGNLELIRLLISSGADPVSPWENNGAFVDCSLWRTLGHFRPEEKTAAILRELMAAGVSITLCGKEVCRQAEFLTPKIAEILFGGSESFRDVRDDNGGTLIADWHQFSKPLRVLNACHRWITEEIVNEHDLDLQTPLMRAMVSKDPLLYETVEALLSLGADPDLPSTAGIATPYESLSTLPDSISQRFFKKSDGRSWKTKSWIEVCNEHEGEMSWKRVAMITPLQAAFLRGRMDLVELMVKTSRGFTTTIPFFVRPDNFDEVLRMRVQVSLACGKPWIALEEKLKRSSLKYFRHVDDRMMAEDDFQGLPPADYLRFLHLLLNSSAERANYPELISEECLFPNYPDCRPLGLACWTSDFYSISLRPEAGGTSTPWTWNNAGLFL